ncbi:caspase family protein, partial [Bradyrhizobium sp. WSM 1738]|nr:caspase family protein [Bradyrhizobium hereditatis]
TARKLEERLRNRPDFTPAVTAANAALPQNVALAAPMCPCNVQPPQQQPIKVNAPVRRVEPDTPKRVDRKPPRRVREQDDDDVVVVRRPPPRVVYEPPPPNPPRPMPMPMLTGGGGNYGDHGGRGRY